MSLNTETLLKILQEQTSCKRFWIAYSGGLDSHVLLDLMLQISQHSKSLHGSEENTIKIGAVHVHHGLSPHADAWVTHCSAVAAECQIPFTVLWVDATVRDGGSPEEVAREARFSAFENFLQAEECLLMAHHAMDQAETILLRLFRGTGPLGLGGMPMHGKLGRGEFLRPLLFTPKETLKDYAMQRELKWIEDESNLNTRFDRNFLRQEVLPLLVARWPRVLRSVSRAGALCLETATAVQVMASSDYLTVKSTVPDQLSVAKLLELDLIRRKAVLRYWLQQLGVALPSLAHLERIDREVLQAKAGAKPRLKISDYEVRRERDNLLLELLTTELQDSFITFS